MNTLQHKILSFLFIAVIGLVWSNQQLHFIKDTKSAENRGRATRPKININQLDSYPKKYNTYYEDNFSLRNRLIKWHTYVVTHIFHKNLVSNKVVIGKNDWLYIVDHELDNYRGIDLFDSTQLRLLKNEFEYRNNILKKQGIKMYFIIVPDKYSIYSENLPDYVKKGNPTRSQQVVNYFAKYSDVKVIYAVDSLRKYKGEIPLYYKYDNHWNELGAYYFSKIITSYLQQDSIHVFNHDINDYTLTSKPRLRGDISSMLPGTKEYIEKSYSLIPKFHAADTIDTIRYVCPYNFSLAYRYQFLFSNNNPELANAVIIRDSFGDNLMPYFRNNVNNSVFIFDAWQYNFNLEIIDNEQPDAVIYLVLENLIGNILDHLTIK